jgi:large-conductance mechanosensitive channel
MIAADPTYHHMTYKTFMRETGIVPIVIAIVLGVSGQQMTKQFVGSIVMPLFQGLRTMQKPMVHIGDFIPSVLVFGLSIAIAAILIKAFSVHKKTVPYVKVWSEKEQ